MIAHRRLRFVILDCIREIWSLPEVRTLFQNIITLKLEGYAATYPDTLIPLDKSDFYGTHVLVCTEDGVQRMNNAPRDLVIV